MSPGQFADTWQIPALAGAAAFFAGVAICVGIAVLLEHVPTSNPQAGPFSILHLGAYVFFLFQRVALEAQIGPATLGESPPVRLVFLPLGGLLLIGTILAAAGRFSAGQRGSQVFFSILRMALIYGTISFVASFFVQVSSLDSSSGIGFGGTPFSVGPSHAGALLLPFVWAVIFGCLGAFRILRGVVVGPAWLASLRFGAWRTELTAAITGVLLAVLLSLIASVVLLVFFILSNDSARSASTSGGGLIGFVLVVPLLVPHAAALVLLGAMGVSTTLTAVSGGTGAAGSVGLLGSSGSLSGISVPWFAVLAFLIPVVACVYMGRVAAAETTAEPRESVKAALKAALLFTLTMWALAWLVEWHVSGNIASITAIFGSTAGSQAAGASTWLGPDGGLAFLLPPLWAFGGAWLGAASMTRRTQAVGDTTAVCPACARKNLAGAKFCAGCGAALSPMTAD